MLLIWTQPKICVLVKSLNSDLIYNTINAFNLDPNKNLCFGKELKFRLNL